MKKLFGILFIFTAVVFAQEIHSEVAENSAIENVDSLRAEIERLTAMLQQVEQEKNIDSITETAEIDTSVKIVRISAKFIDEWKSGDFFGISGGPAVGAIYMDMKPLRNLYRSEGIPVPFNNREPMFLNGGFGLGGFVNGARIGGAGYSARSKFRSYNADRDTVITTSSRLGYGGFIAGRAWGKENSALHLQALIGSGSHRVETEKRLTDGGSFFGTSGGETLKSTKLASNFFATDLQFGHTHSFTRWFHIGGEYSLLFMFSRSGFDFDSYASLSPTAKLRFVFGSLR